MTEPPAPEQHRWYHRATDTAWWLWHSAASTVHNLPQTWREATPMERGRILVDTLFPVLLVALGVLSFPAWFPIAVGVASLLVLLATLSDVEASAHNRERVTRLLAERPTGAPRVAEVAIPGTDITYRFVYGPKGWDFAGPAVSHGPAITREESMRG